VFHTARPYRRLRPYVVIQAPKNMNTPGRTVLRAEVIT